MGSETSQLLYKGCCGDSEEAPDITNKDNYQSFLRAIRNGDIKYALKNGKQNELCNFIPLITGIIAQIPYGTHSYRDQLLSIFQKRCKENIFLSQTFHFFLYSYFNENYVKIIWEKHSIYQYILENDINLVIQENDNNDNTIYRIRAKSIGSRNNNKKQKIDKKRIRDQRQKKILHKIYKSNTDNFRFTKTQKSILQNDIDKTCKINHIEYGGNNVIELFELFCVSQFIDDENNEIEIKSGFKVDIINTNKFCDPINGKLNLQTIQVEKIFNSKTKPLLLSFYNLNAKLTSKTIFKKGDDLRKDASILTMFRLFNDIWSSNKLKYNKKRIKIFTYRCVPICEDFGCIEYIEGCQPLTEIKKYYEEKCNDNQFMNKLIASSVASYIGAYVMGIRDRHSDNILIKQNGILFHIDYGYILGEELHGLDASKFAITNDLQSIMGHKHWNNFINSCFKAFKMLRENYLDILAFAKIAITFLEWNKIEMYLKKRLMIDMNEDEVERYIKEKIRKAPKKWKTKMKNKIHAMAVNAKKS